MLSNPPLCREHQKLILEVPAFPSARPGQFVHLFHEHDELEPRLIPRRAGLAIEAAEGELPTIRRAFSIAGLRRRSSLTELDVIYRVVGKATGWMSQLSAGDRLSLLGPLGNHFTIEKDKRLALLVAGGVGLPPMLWWAEELDRLGIETVAFVGAQSQSLIALTLEADRPIPSSGSEAVLAAREFSRHHTAVVISTDDGTLGYHGVVTEAFNHYVSTRSPLRKDVAVYTCGPELMMKRVAELCVAWEFDCQLCMERSMACGMGTCQSCVVPVHDPHALDGWSYELCCSDGPIFEHHEIIWR